MIVFFPGIVKLAPTGFDNTWLGAWRRYYHLVSRHCQSFV